MSSALNPRFLGRLFKEAALEWDQDNVSRLAAALAYYTAFSLAPLLVIAVAIAGFLFGEEAARDEIRQQIQSLIGAQGAELVQNVIKAASRPGAGVLATAIGLVTLAIGATGAYNQLQDGLNHVWGVAPRPRGAIKSLVRTRIISFAMVLVTGFLLLVSLILSAAIEGFGGYLQGFLPSLPFGPGPFNSLLSFLLITVLFALIYEILPDAEVPRRYMFFGAAVTSLLFAAGKYAIGLYLGNSSVGSAYGAAGTLAILLIWIYYSAQIFYFGAELTQVYTRLRGHPIVPSAHATRIMRVRVEGDTLPDARRLAQETLAAAEATGERERAGGPPGLDRSPESRPPALGREESGAASEATAGPSPPKLIRVSTDESGGTAADATEEDSSPALEAPVEGRATRLPARRSTAQPARSGEGSEPVSYVWSADAEDFDRERRAGESWVDRLTAVVAGLLVGVVVGIAGTRRIVQGERTDRDGHAGRALPPPREGDREGTLVRSRAHPNDPPDGQPDP